MGALFKNGLFKSVLILGLAALAAGCATRELEHMKNWAAAGKWQEIAQVQVSCTAKDETCGQSHLIKGDACYRLSKADLTSPGHLACAADELNRGIHLLPDWSSAASTLGQRGTYLEHWCEATRLLRGQQASTAAALQVNAQLMTCAREYLQEGETAQVPATFFLNNAELAQIRLSLGDPGGCAKLGRLRLDQDQAARTAVGTAYEGAHRQLLLDVTGILHSFPGCS